MKKEYSYYDLWQLFKKYFIRILNMTIIGATFKKHVHEQY